MSKKGKLFLLSGPSGVGKGTIRDRVFDFFPNLVFSISMTTRPKRPHEVDGEDYYFVTREKFEETIEHDGFLEYAEFVGNYYGTPKKKVEETLEKGISILLEIEAQGAMQVMKKHPEVISIFLVPPSLEVLKQRLISRNTEPMETIEKRVQKASEELKVASAYRYVVVNDELDVATNEVIELIEKEMNTV